MGSTGASRSSTMAIRRLPASVGSSGYSGSDPLYPDDPTLAGNRRIAIVLLREAPVLPTDTSL